MIIRDLKPSKQVPGRWLASLEDGCLLRVGENEVLDFDLYAGRELSEDEVIALTQSVERSDRKLRAMNLAAGKPISRRELERKLAAWGADEEEQAALCTRLEELGYLNDAAYAIQVARHYWDRGYGQRKIQDELYRRGIPRELWAKALELCQDPAGAIDAFLTKKLAGRAVGRKELKQAADALARRGYSWSDISDGLRRFGVETED